MSLPFIAQEQLDKISYYFPELTDTQRRQLADLFPLYVEWNARINVISRKDIDNLYLHHVLHSLSIARLVSLQEGTHVLDIGTGGGFPGIPLAILFPRTQFHLVDSIGKKIRVVEEVAAQLQLGNIRAEHARAEKIKGRYDFVISRAVTNLRQLHQWARPRIKGKSVHQLYNGLLCLKGGDLEQELQEAGLNYALYPLAEFFDEEYFQTKYLVYVPL